MRTHKPEFYLYLQSRLLLYSDYENCICYEDAKIRLLTIKITKKMVQKILKELEDLNLITRIGRLKYKVINSNQSKKYRDDYNYQGYGRKRTNSKF